MTCEWIPIEGTVEEILDVNARPFGPMLSSDVSHSYAKSASTFPGNTRWHRHGT